MRQYLKPNDKKRAKTIKTVVYLVAIVFLVVVSILKVLLQIDDSTGVSNFRKLSYLSIVISGVLLIGYTVTIVYLYRTLRSIAELDDF